MPSRKCNLLLLSPASPWDADKENLALRVRAAPSLRGWKNEQTVNFERWVQGEPGNRTRGRGAFEFRKVEQAGSRDSEWLAGFDEGTVYLDHAGATLFPESQLRSFTRDLLENVYGNPHSQSISSKLTQDTVEQVRYRVLAHFHASPEDYSVIFTAGSTAALKLVAEAFPWVSRGPGSSGSLFCYLTDSHTSVVGMRMVATARGVTSIPVRPEDMWSAEKRGAAASDPDCQLPHLFCYPAQSNFSGTRYPLSWIGEVRAGRMCPVSAPAPGRWFVLLDAASYASTSPLDLSAHPADFVSLSFYKIFGFPTGLGALLVHNRVAPLLKKTYFGGGTAAAYLAGEDFYIPRPSVAERFEDGTIPFLDVIALKHGFDALERLTGGMENVQQHTFTLARYTYAALCSLRYPNGAPVVRIYSDSEFRSPEAQGPVINFNVLDASGNVVGYSQVEKMASLFNIQVRTGCFCNTGACQRHLGISDEMVKKHLQAGHVCGDDVDLVDGQPTGSVRISFGYMSTLEDAQAFLKFIIDTRLRPQRSQPVPQAAPGEAGTAPAESEAQSTVPVTLSTTVHTTVPTTIPATMPATVHTTVPATVHTTLSTTVHTTVPTTIPATMPATVHTTVPATLSTTVPTTVLATVPATVPVTLSTTVPATMPTTVPTTLPATGHRPSPSPREDTPTASRAGNDWTSAVGAVCLQPPLQEATGTLQAPPEKAAAAPCGGLGPHVITNLFLYPIKSCAAFEVTRWPVGHQGLLYDRSWMVVNHNGICLSQKQEPRLCLVQPRIDLQQRIMVVRAKGMEPIEVPLEENGEWVQICQSKVCADRVNTRDCGEKISNWLSRFLGRPCHLIKQSSDFQRSAKKSHGKGQSAGTPATLSLVNEAQYLLINRSSVLELQQQLSASDENGREELFPMRELISRFRANIITSGASAFEEEKWEEISIGSLHFQVLGPCHRCQMICIDQQTGQRNQDVFQKLSESRERKVNFGVYLMHMSVDFSSPCFLSVGSQVLPVLKENVESHDLPASEKHQNVVS
ncbi:PREDICTED: molybdenum cofactor sulfurase [Myotis davidii]|uniref:molybdenum cofactor sulfurase n=1 Tax=Myotis davidii TaxID=225400 RepID=UPI000767D2AB|nr:PREDICTED: molybdenum cofactor sulfurase [Myotis davidii]